MKIRTAPLRPEVQKDIIEGAIPARIKVLKQFLGSLSPSYSLTAAAAVFSRAIAGFLGIRLKHGVLGPDHEHFEQSKGASWEVKIVDIKGGHYVDIGSLDAKTKKVLQTGLLEVNSAFAHITFWDSPANQTSAGAPLPAYVATQIERLRKLAQAVIELFEKQKKTIQV